MTYFAEYLPLDMEGGIRVEIDESSLVLPKGIKENIFQYGVLCTYRPKVR